MGLRFMARVRRRRGLGRLRAFFRRRPPFAIAVGRRLARPVATVARKRHVAVRVFLVLPRDLVAAAATTAASASAPTSAAGPVLPTAIVPNRGLLAQSGRAIGRLLHEGFAYLRWLSVLPSHLPWFVALAIAGQAGPFPATMLAMDGAVVIPPASPLAPAARTTPSAVALGWLLGLLGNVLLVFVSLEARLHVDGSPLGGPLWRHGGGRALDRKVGALHAVARLHRDGHTVAV